MSINGNKHPLLEVKEYSDEQVSGIWQSLFRFVWDRRNGTLIRKSQPTGGLTVEETGSCKEAVEKE